MNIKRILIALLLVTGIVMAQDYGQYGKFTQTVQPGFLLTADSVVQVGQTVMPDAGSVLARMGIPHRLIVTHSNDHLSGKFRHITRGLPALIAAIREYRAQKLIPVVHAHTGKWPS